MMGKGTLEFWGGYLGLLIGGVVVGLRKVGKGQGKENLGKVIVEGH